MSLSLETMELSPGKAGELFSLRNMIAAVYISPKETIPQKELDQVDAMEPGFKGKSPAQRLRGVLFILFGQSNEGYKDFDSYYKAKMEGIIQEYKNNIA